MQEQTPTLRVVNAEEIKPIQVWERLYPDLWMLIEVTSHDEWEVYEGKLNSERLRAQRESSVPT